VVKVRDLLIEAVRKRLSSDRGVGVFCSGGLDSVSVLACVRHVLGPNARINTYTVGMPGSTDLHFAKKAAEYFKTEHFEACLSEEQFLDAVRETALVCETWDTTTIRASVGNLLVSKLVQ
jgi:asparagine synthase (glutamine-hydrolysing)